MTDPFDSPRAAVLWTAARRIIRTAYPPIDLFEDIADPADWPLLIAAEQRTNPRLVDSVGALDLVPPRRRVGGPGSTYLMAPFTHVSPDRPSRFSDGVFGVLYVAESFETALLETVHHHGLFMARTGERPGWTSQFRELRMKVDAQLIDLRVDPASHPQLLRSQDYQASQAFGQAARGQGADGVVYPSQRRSGGECAGLFYPDLASNLVQERHLDYHWNGERVDYVRDLSSGEVVGLSETGIGAPAP